MISGQVCLRRGETLAAGCCWIYDNEIDWADDTCEDGGLVEVLDSRMRYQGTGFFNRRSKITARLARARRDHRPRILGAPHPRGMGKPAGTGLFERMPRHFR